MSTHRYSQVPGGDGLRGGLHTAHRPASSRRTLRGNTLFSGGGCVTMIKNKWALFGVTFFYLLEQMYSASFSAFPHCCPSVSRPILFTGKQQKMYLFTWLLTSLYSCAVFLTYKYKGTCVTRHAGSLRRGPRMRPQVSGGGAGSWPHPPEACGSGNAPIPLRPAELTYNGGDTTMWDCSKDYRR